MREEHNDTPLEAKVRTTQAADGHASKDKLEPATIIIFGASGDLTFRKLIPSLFSLFRQDMLPDDFVIMGAARTEMNDASFREYLREKLEDAREDLAGWDVFAAKLHYRTLDYNNPEDYAALDDILRDLSDRFRTRGNRLYYLAIPPKLYPKVASRLSDQGLGREDEGRGWRRLVVEKPFGHDLASARELVATLHRGFREDQIYRIDHYLAKETVQNVLMFRFANSIFEPVWNRRYVKYVRIIAAETLGVGRRAGYYEESGVLRDMFQNHMMQLLALCAMEPPSKFEADRVQDEKAKVFRSLRPFPLADLDDYLVLGQYHSGVLGGRRTAAYRDEDGVAGNSITPTFAAMRILIDNWRWKGVPFLLVSGKRLAQKTTKIEIRFRGVPHSMFRDVLGEHISANTLTIGVQPEEVINLNFQTKRPGSDSLRSVTMRFDYHQDFQGVVLDAYARALLDCMLGDHMLFWRQDGVDLTWSYFTPIVERCESCELRQQRLEFYEPGSWGPSSVANLLPEKKVDN